MKIEEFNRNGSAADIDELGNQIFRQMNEMNTDLREEIQEFSMHPTGIANANFLKNLLFPD